MGRCALAYVAQLQGRSFGCVPSSRRIFSARRERRDPSETDRRRPTVDPRADDDEDRRAGPGERASRPVHLKVARRVFGLCAQRMGSGPTR